MDEASIFIEDVARRIDATARNIKYWTRVYRLPVERQGRRNLYPPRTVELLGAIASLARLEIHTTRFIRWMVDGALERPIEDAAYRAYHNKRPQWEAILKMASLTAPPATHDNDSAKAAARSRTQARRREDEIIL